MKSKIATITSRDLLNNWNATVCGVPYAKQDHEFTCKDTGFRYRIVAVNDRYVFGRHLRPGYAFLGDQEIFAHDMVNQVEVMADRGLAQELTCIDCGKTIRDFSHRAYSDDDPKNDTYICQSCASYKYGWISK